MKSKIILIVLMFFLISISLGKKKPLYIGVLLELSESWYAKYTNFFPIMFDDAFKRIYNRSDILEGYEFKMIIRDTKVRLWLLFGAFVRRVVRSFVCTIVS
jgi:hypothetical protein